MAKAELDPLFRGISGAMSGFIFKRSKSGGAIVAKRPQKSNAAPSEAQIAHRNKFRQATAYAKTALARPAVRAYYKKKALRLKTTPYALAIADYFKDTNLLANEQDFASFDPSI